jgi:sec-independent protein translocase protein TatA
MNPALLAFGMPGTTELIIIAVIALLVFGRRLPDVARSVGKSIVEFKKGLKDVSSEIDVQSRIAPPAQQAPEQPTAPTVTSTPPQTSGESKSKVDPPASAS